MADCRAEVERVVEIELPAAWEASSTYSVLSVRAEACCEHAPELERRAQALLAARADIHNLLVIVENAVAIEADFRARVALSEWTSPDDVTVTHGAGLISAERARQLGSEGLTAEHDDKHRSGELARAAAAYAAPAEQRWMTEDEGHVLGWVPSIWPWDGFEPWDGSAWKPSPNDRVRELVKAGALLAAEIDRLLRLRARSGGSEQGVGGSAAE